MGVRIIGLGTGLPKKCVSNDELAKTVDTSDEWIRTRTGITQRYMADGITETTSTMALAAAEQALADAKLTAEDIDLVIVGTSTADLSFPSVACQVIGKLGIVVPAFDVQAACSGFVYALSIADDMMARGPYKNALIIGAERFTNLIDFNDRTTCVLFGDGAGAAVITKGKEGEGLLSKRLGAEGHIEALYATGGIGTNGVAGKVMMNGREVFRHAVRRMSETVQPLLDDAKLTVDDLTWFIPHQANARILTSVAEAVNLPEEKLVMTVQLHANTSAASIPLALKEMQKQGKLKAGDLIMLNAFGAGFAWGGALLRW